MAKKRRAKRSRSVSTAGRVHGVDLAAVLRREGLDENQIPEVLAFIRTLSNAQSGEGAPPVVPMPPIPHSAEAGNVAAAATEVTAADERHRNRTQRLRLAGRNVRVQGARDMLWSLETSLVRSRPRISFVGRAIQEHSVRPPPAQASGTVPGITNLVILEQLQNANIELVPPRLQACVRIIREGSPAETSEDRRHEEKEAQSAIKKRVAKRTDVLVNRLHYAEISRARNATEYRITPRGRRIFNDWPLWNASDGESHPEDAG